MLQTSTQPTDYGTIFSVANPAINQSGRVFLRSTFADGTALSGPLAGLYIALEAASADIAQSSARLQPEALIGELKIRLPVLLRGPLSEFTAAITRYNTGLATVRTELSTPSPTTAANQAARDRAVRMFDRADGPRQIEMATRTCDLEGLSALVLAGALASLPADVQDVPMTRFMALKYAVREGLAAKWPVKATADNPVPTGIDQAGMMKEADAFIAGMRKNESIVLDATQIVRDVIVFVAVACQCSAEDAHSLLTTTAN